MAKKNSGEVKERCWNKGTRLGGLVLRLSSLLVGCLGPTKRPPHALTDTKPAPLIVYLYSSTVPKTFDAALCVCSLSNPNFTVSQLEASTISPVAELAVLAYKRPEVTESSQGWRGRFQKRLLCLRAFFLPY